MEKLINRWSRAFLVVAAVLTLSLSYFDHKSQMQINNELKQQAVITEMQLETVSKTVVELKATIDTLRETHPYLRKKWNGKTSMCKSGSFFGFLLYTPVDTAVNKELVVALSDYKGPTAKINSLRRNYNPSSEHFHGKAVDLAWDVEVINFLVSEEGKEWLQKHRITFYIEGQPGSKRVAKYLGDRKTAPYVFFNPEATGNHIHLNV